MGLSLNDKIEITELCNRYNLAIDNSDIDKWLETWTEDGIMEGNFINAKGRNELKNVLVDLEKSGLITGKRNFSTSITSDGEGNIAKVISYLIVIEAVSMPKIVATAVYTDELKKINGKWQFYRRKLIVDPNLQHIKLLNDQ